MEYGQGQIASHLIGQTAKLNQLNQTQWVCGKFPDGEIAAPLGNIVAKDEGRARKWLKWGRKLGSSLAKRYLAKIGE